MGRVSPAYPYSTVRYAYEASQDPGGPALQGCVQSIHQGTSPGVSLSRCAEILIRHVTETYPRVRVGIPDRAAAAGMPKSPRARAVRSIRRWQPESDAKSADQRHDRISSSRLLHRRDGNSLGREYLDTVQGTATGQCAVDSRDGASSPIAIRRWNFSRAPGTCIHPLRGPRWVEERARTHGIRIAEEFLKERHLIGWRRRLDQHLCSPRVLFLRHAEVEVCSQRTTNLFTQELANRPAAHAPHYFAHQKTESQGVVTVAGARFPPWRLILQRVYEWSPLIHGLRSHVLANGGQARLM